jgi:type IV pilus assembly protein PilA
MRNKNFKKSSGRGFTLIEVLIVMGIIAILATIVLVAVNPGRQFKLARDSQRTSNVNAILNALHQNIAENKGSFICSGTVKNIPDTATVIKSTPSGSDADIGPCLVPDYISALPFDPSVSGAHFTSVTDYDTGYEFYRDASGRVTVKATGEISSPILVTR